MDPEELNKKTLSFMLSVAIVKFLDLSAGYMPLATFCLAFLMTTAFNGLKGLKSPPTIKHQKHKKKKSKKKNLFKKE